VRLHIGIGEPIFPKVAAGAVLDPQAWLAPRQGSNIGRNKEIREKGPPDG